MANLTFKRITALQKTYGFSDMQELINKGHVWTLEGSVGREASRLLDSGACMLPKVPRRDYYGNTVPSRDMLKPGTKGTFKNSQVFWKGVEDGTIEIDPMAEMD